MTDTTSSPKKKRKIFLPIAVLIVLVVAAAFIASRAGIDKALAKQKLDAAIVQFKDWARAQGRDVEITYGELDVVGGLTSRHVVIHHPVMSVKAIQTKPQVPGQEHAQDSLLVSTPTMEIYPEAMDFSALRLQLPEPINFAAADAPDKSLMKMVANSPLVLVIAQETQKNVAYNHVKYISPTEVDYTYLREQQAKGAEDTTPQVVPVYDTLRVTYAPGSSMESNFAADGSQLGTASINFGQMVMTPQSAPQGAVTVGGITGQWTNQLNDKQQNQIHGVFNLGPITAPADVLPYAPVSLAMDMTYEAQLLKTPEAVAAAKSQESTMTIKTFSITTKDSSISATGNFVADASDVLPVGKANIAIVNMPFVLNQLRTYMLLNPANEPLITPLLQLITGTPVDQLKDVNIAIDRERGGSFKIGQTTFEELFATFLKTAMKRQPDGAPSASPVIAPGTPSPHAPALPPADKPKPKAIAVPESGTRG